MSHREVQNEYWRIQNYNKVVKGFYFATLTGTRENKIPADDVGSFWKCFPKILTCIGRCEKGVKVYLLTHRWHVGTSANASVQHTVLNQQNKDMIPPQSQYDKSQRASMCLVEYSFKLWQTSWSKHKWCQNNWQRWACYSTVPAWWCSSFSLCCI